METGAPAFISENWAVLAPATAAVTTYPGPPEPLAVNGAVAVPLRAVTIVIAGVPLLNLPEGLEAGAVKVTLAAATGVPSLSTTVTSSGVENAVLMLVICGVVPWTLITLAGAPALARKK